MFQRKVKLGKLKITFSMNESLSTRWSEIMDKFFIANLDSKYKSLIDPYRTMLRFADLIVHIDNHAPKNEPIRISLEENYYYLFYLIKRSIWIKFNRTFHVVIKNEQESKKNYLLTYMSNFVLKFITINKMQLSNKKDIFRSHVDYYEFLLNSESTSTTDYSNLFFEQHNLFSIYESNKVAVPKNNRLSIDVVMPTRNVPLSQVMRAIDSFENQLEHDDKIILIDDNDEAQDELRMLVNKYKKLIYMVGSKNGVADARNIGISYGKSDLVAFIDSDDYVSNQFIDIQRNFHIHNSDVAATGTWIESFGSIKMTYPQWDNLVVFSLTHCLPPAGVLMWKRRILQDILHGFNSSFAAGFEDFDLTARASILKESIVVLEEVHYFYQRGHSSLTQSWLPIEEYLLTKKVLSNARSLGEKEFSYFLDLYERFGPGMGRIPIDELTKKTERMREDKLYWILINRVRLNSKVRKSWLLFPRMFRVVLNKIIWVLAQAMDKIHETKLGNLIDPIYKLLRKKINKYLEEKLHS